MLLSNKRIKKLKVLIVDDTLSHVLLLKDILSDMADTFFSTTAEDALHLIPKVSPDLILLDIEMPGMTGLELCKKLKSEPRTQTTPIIFITSHEEYEIEALAFELGAADFISKPFNRSVCRLRVQNQLTIESQRRQIQQAQEQLEGIVKQVPVYISYWSEKWKCLYSNDEGSWFPAIASVEQEIDDLLPYEISSEIRARGFLQKEESYTVQVKGKTGAKYYQIHQSAASFTHHEDSQLITILDVSSEQKAKEAVFSEKERLRVTLNSIGDAVVATDLRGRITFMNAIAERLTGKHLLEVIGKPVEKVMMLQDSVTKNTLENPLYFALKEQRTVAMALNSELVSHSGKTYAVRDSAAPIRDSQGELIGAIMVFHDESEALSMAAKMSHIVNHDPLTGLANRFQLQGKLVDITQSADKSDAAVILVNIDHFKFINESLGHQKGDELIRQVAERINALTNDSDMLARLNGDEFVLLISEMLCREHLEVKLKEVSHTFDHPFDLGGQMYKASACIGVSILNEDACEPEQLMRHADVAMYRAKQDGRNQVRIFSPDLEADLLKRHEIEKNLREALMNHTTQVFFQPKYTLDGSVLVGAEALVRLPSKEGGLIPPNHFIPLAEESGLILELGRQVMLQTCRALRDLSTMGISLPISINVSAEQLCSNRLIEDLKISLIQYAIPPELLEIEITETALMVDVEKAKDAINKVKALGIKVSVDDFGTGYSSLSYLKTFDLDYLKVDMSFVQDMLDNRHDYEIVKAIISLGHTMGLKIVAEGIETIKQKEALQALGCELGQGYLFSKPLRFDEFKQILPLGVELGRE